MHRARSRRNRKGDAPESERSQGGESPSSARASAPSSSQQVPAYAANAPVVPLGGDASPVQTKLAVSRPGDAGEREADAVADHVVSNEASAPPAVSTAPPSVATQTEEEKEPEEEEESAQASEGEVQREASSEASGASADSAGGGTAEAGGGASVSNSFGRGLGGGSPLPEASREHFESRFARDFGDVRVHTGPEAERSARSVGARAFTKGRDVVFDAGEYAPGTRRGDRLLAHELTHVVQQRSGSGGGAQLQKQPAGEQPATPAAQPAAAAQTPARADVLSWRSVLPHSAAEARALKKKDPEKWKVVEDICAQIEARRKAMPKKKYQSSPLPKKTRDRLKNDTLQGRKYTAYDSPSAAQIKATPAGQKPPEFADESAQTSGYRDWLKGAKVPEVRAMEQKSLTPEGEVDPSGVKIGDELRIQLVIWKELLGDKQTPGEGDPSAVNTYDSERMTWGPGFSAKGGMMTEMMFKHLIKPDKPKEEKTRIQSEIEDDFLGVGVSVEAGKKPGEPHSLIIVHTTDKYQAHGSTALDLLQVYVPDLVDIFVHVAQGSDFLMPDDEKALWQSDYGKSLTKTDPHLPYYQRRQAVYDAQWAEFKDKTGNVKDYVDELKGWGDSALGFAGHIVHWGKLTWASLVKTKGSAAALRDAVLPTLTRTGNVIEGFEAESFMRFGNGLMKTVMTEVPAASDSKRTYVKAGGKTYQL